VCYGFLDKQNTFLIGDPAKGVYELSIPELEKIWQSKTCLTLEPNTTFVKQEEAKNIQKQWFLNLIKEDYNLLWISVMLGVFVAGLGMAMSLFSQKLIDDILPSHNSKKLITGIILLGILLLARVGISVLREYIMMQQSKDFNNRINNSFFSALLMLPKPFFDTRKIGEMVARLNDTQRIQRVIRTVLGNSVIDILVVLISIGFLFNYSWQLGCTTLISIPLYFFLIYKNNKAIINSQKEVMQSYAFSESNYINTIQGIETIKNNNRQETFSKLNELIFSNYQDKIFSLGKLNIKLSWQSGIATVLFLISVIVYTSLKVFYKEIKLGELMAILGIVSTLMPSIANLALLSIPINEAKIAFNRMFEFASTEKETEDGILINHISQIELKNISFRFTGRGQLFQDVSIKIQKGKVVALIGESGGGKSTIGAILQGFYSFENGIICINDQLNFNEVSLNSYRNLIAVIPQEIALFNGTVIDNIVLGENINTEKVVSFLTDYGFMTFFNQLPQGLFTILGEEGINLSGGQKQLIALARAIYKKPQLLILDEATAAMDRNTEKFTLELLKRINPFCAIFYISHRIKTLENFADTIYILENKTINDYGTAKELMRFTNFYSDYFSDS
jgi:ATP-binding cassette subfamily B protein